METPTQTLHRLTSYAPDADWMEPLDDPRLVKSFESTDLDRLPWFYKRYAESLPRIDLPRDLPRTAASAVEVLAGTAEIEPNELDLAQLARSLHLSAGVVRTMDRPYGKFLFRAAGSAGGRFPLELYVAIPDDLALPGGVHWYDPLGHALVRVGPAPRGGAPALVVTGVPWRTGWRYRERGYRHIFWDTGSMLAQLLAVAGSAGIRTALHTRFPDGAIAELVGADRVHEFPVAVVTLGEGDPAVVASGSAVSGEVDSAPIELPLVTAAQKAGEGDGFERAWTPGDPVETVVERGAPLDVVALARGSQRRMDRSLSVAQTVLRTSMSVALRGIDLTHYVVVHAVEGLESGLYRWPDLSEPVRPGPMRDLLFEICLKQGLGREAAFVAIAATSIRELDDREYREAHLAAGLASGRIHLAAYSLGVSATGMTFLDSEIPKLLGENLDGVLFTCVGVPEYRSRPGGGPGSPTRVKRVVPRMED